ncbi:hypothetical protein ACJJIP_16525 [Microbulbifer sp. VTAC004]|uniref:hypothetical protein n=1 Tax=Microbulbifer sp. VTAC004 TaxID=3243386 RepID=UPI00403900C2
MRRVILLTVFLAACATTPEMYQPNLNKAVLVAQNDAWGKSFIPLETQANTRIEAIDGEKVSDFFNSTKNISIDPGEHKVVVSCYLRRGGLHQKAEHEFIQTFKKGIVYVFAGKLGKGPECEVDIEQRT